ncbi:MAG: carbohydrate binding family 9 domain-containing protein, partial [Imperialibacter sp.]
MRKTIITFIFGQLFFLDATSQEVNDKKSTGFQSKYQLRIERAKDPIVLDGELNESTWQTADVATDFWMKFPRDDQKAPRQTEMRAAYDEKFLYISAVCYDTSYYVVQTLKRDIRYFDGDGIAVVLDPVNKKTNGFFFGVSPMNVQAEDLLASSSNNLNFSWDNKWFSEVTRHEDRWIVEMAIPFKTLRFEANNDEWGINFIRNDVKANQYHAWTN